MAERLICLLPVRNAAADLPGYFASVRRFCDGVVALDDGSTDETRALLEAEPLVRVMLENPRRADYRGWDDAANRNRTLAAAAVLEPTWLISLDADERVDEADGAALRAFLETDALPGCAYGFRHVPMRGGPGQFLPRYQWIYRLFAYEPGQRFPNQRLHFIPIPTSIPRQRWLRTTLRVQHLGGSTAERRLARFAKYLEADPNRTYQADYAHLLAGPDPAALRTWTPRPPGLPVLLAPGAPSEFGDDADLIAEDRVRRPDRDLRDRDRPAQSGDDRAHGGVGGGSRGPGTVRNDRGGERIGGDRRDRAAAVSGGGAGGAGGAGIARGGAQCGPEASPGAATSVSRAPTSSCRLAAWRPAWRRTSAATRW